MSRPVRRNWLIDLIESAPSVAFLYLWRSGTDLETAGWVGAALAAALLAGFHVLKIRSNPIFLGINIHLIFITPLIIVLFRLGAQPLSAWLEAHSYQAVLVTILATGCALTLFSPAGFIGAENLPRRTNLACSALMLAAAAGAAAWAFSGHGGAFTTVALPVIGLFALRRLLLARNTSGSAPLYGAATISALSTDRRSEV